MDYVENYVIIANESLESRGLSRQIIKSADYNVFVRVCMCVRASVRKRAYAFIIRPTFDELFLIHFLYDSL